MAGNRDRETSSAHYIGRQEARTINNADTVNQIGAIHLAPREPAPHERAQESLRLGETSLHQGLYDSAVTHLAGCLSLGALDPSAAAHARFLLVLASLGGRRPSLCTNAELASALDLLSPLCEPHARFLAVLVEEDRTNAWMGSLAVPDSLRRKAQQVDRLYADLIRRHVPASESRVWQALNERAGGTTPCP